MKKKIECDLTDEARPEYDAEFIRSMKRNTLARRFKGVRFVPIAPDVAAAFPAPQDVNKALRLLIKAARIPRTKAAKT